MSSDSTLASTMTLRQLKDAMSEHIDARAEHKVRSGLTAVTADVARIDKSCIAFNRDMNGNGKPGIKTQLALGEKRMESIEGAQREGFAAIRGSLENLSEELRDLFERTNPGPRGGPVSLAPPTKRGEDERTASIKAWVKIAGIMITTAGIATGGNYVVASADPHPQQISADLQALSAQVQANTQERLAVSKMREQKTEDANKIRELESELARARSEAEKEPDLVKPRHRR